MIKLTLQKSTNIALWDNPNKKGDPIMKANETEKTFDLSDEKERKAFIKLKDHLYIEGVETSNNVSDVQLKLTYTPANTSFESIVDTMIGTVVKVEYVRLYDKNRIANRTTRAINPKDRRKKKYEDNERSDIDISDNRPMMVLGTWSDDIAHVNLEVKYYPDGIGEYIRWKIDNKNGFAKKNEGDFKEVDKIELELIPSNTWIKIHEGKDFIIEVGIDRNRNKKMEKNESLIKYGVRIIGKKEYEYCKSELNNVAFMLLRKVGGVKRPDASELIDIFMKTNWIAGYNLSTETTVKFTGGYDQRNGLGCNPISLTEGRIKKYIWFTTSKFGKRILQSEAFWKRVLEPTIKKMRIMRWYNENSKERKHSFTKRFYGVVDFAGDDNLKLSLGKATVDIYVTLDTEIGEDGRSKIKLMSVRGSVRDLYDFRTHTSDSWIGYASRIQTCYSPNIGRNAGEIFKVEIQCNAYIDSIRIDYMDYELLKYLWENNS